MKPKAAALPTPKRPSLNDLPPLAYDSNGDAIPIPPEAEAWRVHQARRSDRTSVVLVGRVCSDAETGQPLFIGCSSTVEAMEDGGCAPGLYALVLVDGYGKRIESAPFAVVELRDAEGLLPVDKPAHEHAAATAPSCAHCAALSTALVAVARANADTAVEAAKVLGQLVGAFAQRVHPSSAIIPSTAVEAKDGEPQSLTEGLYGIAKAAATGFGTAVAERTADKLGDVAKVAAAAAANGVGK